MIRHKHRLAVIVPAFRAARTIGPVIGAMPPYVDHIIVVDDLSPDNLEEVVAAQGDERIVYLRHDHNKGVGGAMVTGYRKALELGASLVAKVDADDQMDPVHLGRLSLVALDWDCDYVKANRFGRISHLEGMPRARLLGNIFLSFLTKVASGYWNIFDPQNGYTLITGRMLKRLDLNRIDESYFFENSMLIHLNVVRARVGELYLPAKYGNEQSSMKLARIVASFPLKLLRGFFSRVFQKYILRSTSPIFIYLVFGILGVGWGVVFGIYAWLHSYLTGQVTTTGQALLAVLPFLMGWTAILQAVSLDAMDCGPSILMDWDDERLNEDYERNWS